MIDWYRKNNYWVKWIISIGLLCIIFYRVDLKFFFEAFKTVGWEYYLLLILILFGLQTLSALKWKVFLPNHSFGELLKLNLVANFYAFLIPSSFTVDATRAIKTDKKDKGSIGVITSVFMDKWLGLLSVIILMLFSFCFYSIQKIDVFFVPLIVLSLLMFLITYFLFSGTLTLIVSKITNIFFKPEGKIALYLGKLIKLLENIAIEARNKKAIILNLLLAIIFQLVNASASYALGLIMHMELNFWDFCLLTCLIQLVMLLPLSIAGIGAKDVSVVALLGLAGISNEKALAFSLIGYPVILLFVFVGYILDQRK